ncbi:hypothetical protein [Niabella ginsengisoli]|uniref:POTRA domain-containing protein n=1 Tax=Niabella ginsengisoli TaxID=522298 RepID=A0ABS9SM05_9BACT|nr:hypothetical protein [Niabella ginsengisoli]MCH5599416.1 hypothetical protein [Niabella ginsengisoli]
MRTKLGEPPVLMSDVKIQNNINVLQSYLISKGYLQASVSGDTEIEGKKDVQSTLLLRTNVTN